MRVVPGRLRLVTLVVLAATAAPAGAQTPTVRAEVDTTVVTLGDRIQLSVSVTHAPGARVVWPDSLDVAPFEVLDARVAEPAARDGRATTRAVLTLTAFELGTLTLPAIPLTVVDAGDTVALSTDPFGIEVASVGVDETGDIREIRGPLALPGGVARSLLWLVIVAAALIAFGLWWARRGGDDGPAEPAAPPKAPHEAALEALGALASSSHLMEGRIKEFHIELSDILRRYVERRFHVPALEMTTWEVTRGLQRVSAPAEFRTRLEALLQRCDMVKFAKVRPAADDARALLEEGRAVVVLTVPDEAATTAVPEEASP